MDIKFKVNNQEYQLKDRTGDFMLNRYYGTKEVVNKDTGKVSLVDNVDFVGNLPNIFYALDYIASKDQPLSNDATELLELRDIYFNTLKDVKEIAEQFRIKE